MHSFFIGEGVSFEIKFVLPGSSSIEHYAQKGYPFLN